MKSEKNISYDCLNNSMWIASNLSSTSSIEGVVSNFENSMLSLPKLISTQEFSEVLEVQKHDRFTTLYLDGISIVSYSENGKSHLGKKISLQKNDLPGYLFFNTDFFKNFNLKKSMETKSDMKNLAKTFFKFNNKNYVALAQYLYEGGNSSEHYHTLTEFIVQLAGSSYINLRSIDDDTNCNIVELKPGDVFKIPPNYLHFVGALDSGSLTIPIKQTLKSKKDHLYLEKSSKRILNELETLVYSHYSSGDEVYSTVKGYFDTLNFKSEKEITLKTLTNIYNKDKNPNLKLILDQIKF